MPTPTGDAVVVRGLLLNYGTRRAVDGIDLEATPGAVTAILGPNGAGKTTTVECCEGLRQADGGTVRVLGVDPWRAGADHRARVGVMLQDGGLPMGARALPLLRHVARLHQNPRDVDRLAAELGVDDFARTPVRRLSGGQRQRLSLACALVGHPEILFLDEPSAGLDPQGRLAVWGLIERVRDQGCAIVLTTHLMDEAERLANHVLVMDAGHVVASGSPAELTGGEHAGDSLRFRARPDLDLTGLRAALPAALRIEESQRGEYFIGGSVDPRVLSTVTSWCAAQGIMAEGLTVGRRSLEDVFLELTGRSLR